MQTNTFLMFIPERQIKSKGATESESRNSNFAKIRISLVSRLM